MLTPSDIQTITSELRIIQSHKDAMEKSVEKIMGILKNQGVQIPLTELGARAVSDRRSKLFKQKSEI